MREIQASDAEDRLPELLTEVEHGETIVITREGRPIARLVPERNEAGRDRTEVMRAIEAFRKGRKGMPKVTVEEIPAWRHEGHDR